jgi:SAM-dependent methyltransferase
MSKADVEAREREFWNARAAGGPLEAVTNWQQYAAAQKLVWVRIHGLALDLCGRDLGSKRVLDLGCGRGIATACLAQRGADVTCLDVSDEMVRVSLARAQAGGWGSRVRGFAGPLAELREPPGSFDAVFAGAVLHHLPDFEGDMRRLAKLLRPGGVLVSYDPWSSPLFDWARRRLGYRDKGRSEDEEPIGAGHIRIIREVLGEARIWRMGPFTAAERVLMTDWRPLWAVLRGLDRAWLALTGGSACWHVVVRAVNRGG